MAIKLCKRCGFERPIEDFPEHKAGKRGIARRFLCKEHWEEYCKERRERLREHYNEWHREHYRKNAAKKASYMKDRNARVRYEILCHYGGDPPKCDCCGETILEFLCLDHKDGGGEQHRKEVGGNGMVMYTWIKKNNFPDMFRVLCHNCNSALGYYGYCPHQLAKDIKC